MEKEYRKELDRVYLVLAEGQIDEEEYVLQMAMRGRLPGILPLSVFAKDGKKSLRADVTACTSITSRFSLVALTGSDVRKVLSSVRDTASKMPSLLMSVRDLYLDPECIFLGPGGDEVLLCYVPHISDTEPDSVRLLSEFLLKKLDHSDQVAMQLAYPLYDQISADSYDLFEVLSKLLPDTRSSTGKMAGVSGSRDGVPSYGRESSRGSNPYVQADHASAYGYDTAGTSGTYDNVSGKALYDGTSKRPASDGGPVYGAGSDYDEFSGTTVRKLPPPGRKRKGGRDRSGHRRSQKSSGNSKRRNASSGRRTAQGRSGLSLRALLPAAIILPAAVLLIVVFQMDMTQVLGMGFLCVSLIWIIHSSLEKRSNEARNIWFDAEEDMESDDRFYQSLRNELYAEDPQFSGHAQKAWQDSGQEWQKPQPGSGQAWQKPQPDSGQAWQRPQPDSGQEWQRPQPGSGQAWQRPQPVQRDTAGESSGSPQTDTSEKTRFLRHQTPALISLDQHRCQDIHLDQDHLILGKSRSQADIVLPGDTVSRKHARIERRMDGYYVTDLFSTNGTFLDGHRLESGQAAALKNGAQLTIASLPYRFVTEE